MGWTDACMRMQYLSRPLVNKEEPTKGRTFQLSETIKRPRVGMGLGVFTQQVWLRLGQEEKNWEDMRWE